MFSFWYSGGNIISINYVMFTDVFSMHHSFSYYCYFIQGHFVCLTVNKTHLGTGNITDIWTVFTERYYGWCYIHGKSHLFFIFH